MDQTQHYGKRALLALSLSDLINYWGFNPIDIAVDSGVPFEALNQFRHGNYDALTEAEADRVATMATLFVSPERDYVLGEQEAGRKPKRRTIFHEIRDAGIDVREHFGMKI